MTWSRRSNSKSAFANQVPDLQISPDPSLEAGASCSSPKDDWVECCKCKKWRLICVSDVKAQSLPQNWECREMTWLPGFNRCEFSEETTTTAGYKLLGVPVENINFDILNGNGYNHVAKVLAPPLSTNASQRAVAFGQGTRKTKYYPEVMGRKRECKLKRNHQEQEAGKRENIKLGTADTSNGRSLSKPGCSESGNPTACSLSELKATLKSKAGENAWKDRYCPHKETGGLLERRSRLEVATKDRTPRNTVVTNEPGCSESGGHRVSSQSGAKTSLKAHVHTGENFSALKDRYHTKSPRLLERSQETDDHEVLTKERRHEALTIEVLTEERIPQFVDIPAKQKNAHVPTSQDATEVPTEERSSRWETVEARTKESRQLVTNREIQINNSFTNEEPDYWVKNARMEAAALIQSATDCRKRMPDMEDERPIADLYLQAALKYLQTTRRQEVMCREDISYLHNCIDGVEMLDDCIKIYEKFPDYGKAALCHILSGVSRMRLLTVIRQTSLADFAKLRHTANLYNWQSEENQGTGRQSLGGCSEGTQAHLLEETGTSPNYYHMKPLLKTELPLEPSPKSTISVLVPSFLHSTYNRFLENSAHISPMLDSWMKARNCLAFAEASGGDSKSTKVMLEVRKVCEFALFDDFEKLCNQVYVAMDAYRM